MSIMQQTTGYVYANELLQYRFSNDHPFNQMRLKLTTELLMDLGSLKKSISYRQELRLMKNYYLFILMTIFKPLDVHLTVF